MSGDNVISIELVVHTYQGVALQTPFHVSFQLFQLLRW